MASADACLSSRRMLHCEARGGIRNRTEATPQPGGLSRAQEVDMSATHSRWRCPTCDVIRETPPTREAFCTDDFAAMVPHPETITDAALAYPEMTPAQRGIDHIMRTNGDLRT